MFVVIGEVGVYVEMELANIVARRCKSEKGTIVVVF
jgi:hypothetical protein